MIGRYATFLKPLQPTQCWPDALLICLAACLNLEQAAMVGADKKKQKNLHLFPSTVSVTALKGCTLYEQVICYD